MGLDFGLSVVNKETFNSFNGDKEAFHQYLEDNDYDAVAPSIYNNCGWGNPIEFWFKHGLDYYTDYSGYLMRALTPEDIYNVIQEGFNWYKTNINPVPVAMGRAFKENSEEEITLINVTGIEVMDENQAYHRFYAEDADGRLFMTKEWVDMWDIDKFQYFVAEMIDILKSMNWDKDVLLYYVSY